MAVSSWRMRNATMCETGALRRPDVYFRSGRGSFDVMRSMLLVFDVDECRKVWAIRGFDGLGQAFRSVANRCRNISRLLVVQAGRPNLVLTEISFVRNCTSGGRRI